MGNAQIISGTMSLQEPVMMRKGNNSGISEIMGELIIVALVVTLAGIIGAMAFGLVGNMPKSSIVAITAERIDSRNVSVVYFGGEKQDQLYWLNITVNGTGLKTLGVQGGTLPLDVGNSTVVHAPVPGNDHVVVVGNFADGSQQILLDTFV